MSYINNPATGGGGGGTPGGTNGQIQYNNGGTFGGFTMGGDATVNPSTGVLTLTAGAVSNSKMANMPAFTLKGNNAASSGPPIDLTVVQSVQLLDLTEAWHTLCGGV